MGAITYDTVIKFQNLIGYNRSVCIDDNEAKTYNTVKKALTECEIIHKGNISQLRKAESFWVLLSTYNNLLQTTVEFKEGIFNE